MPKGKHQVTDAILHHPGASIKRSEVGVLLEKWSINRKL
jgi:hypothetical protein